MDNMDNNKVTIAGQIISGFTFTHEVYGENFYLVDITVQRLSNSIDIIPLMISDRLIDINQDYIDKYVIVTGQFRSYNLKEETRSHLMLSVFVKGIEIIDAPNEDTIPSLSNCIYLDGYVCKPVVYRKTPLGREIADVLLAVNRPYGKSDYIPCICWGRNARFAEGFQVGEHIQICGRIQSREYVKPGETEVRIAYEVSVVKIDSIKEEGAA